jgi:hypothetical protein
MRALQAWRPSLPASPGLALVQRDFIRSLRRVRPFVFLVVLMVVQWYIVSNVLPRSNTFLMNTGQAAQSIFLAFTLVMLAAGALLLPGAAATSVVLEREQDTYDLVRLTMMRRVTFILAKAANAWGYFFLFVLASMPVAATVFFLTGLEVKQVFFSFSVLLAASVSTTMIGVFASCRARHSMRALLAAYLLTAFFMGGHVLLASLGLRALGLHGMSAAGVHPFWDAILEFFAGSIPAAAPLVTLLELYRGRYGYDLLWRALAYHGVLALLFLWLAWRALHNEQRGKTASPVDRFLNRLHAFRPIPDWVNPIFVKERRWSMGLSRRGRWGLIFFVYVYFFFISWLALSQGGGEHTGIAACLLGFALLCLIVPVLTVTTLTREKELFNIDMLKISMLSAREIVLGKVWAAGRDIMLMAPGPFVAYYVMGFNARGIMSPGKFLLGMLSGSACLFFAVGLSAWIAARSARTATGTTAAYAAGFAIGIGWPLLLVVTTLSNGSDDGAQALLSMTAPFIGWGIAIHEDVYYIPWFIGVVIFFAMGFVFFRMAVNHYLADDSELQEIRLSSDKEHTDSQGVERTHWM